jgi:hypothetical protein
MYPMLVLSSSTVCLLRMRMRLCVRKQRVEAAVQVSNEVELMPIVFFVYLIFFYLVSLPEGWISFSIGWFCVSRT